MNVKKDIVHYLSKSQNHIARRKEILSFKYKDYFISISLGNNSVRQNNKNFCAY